MENGAMELQQWNNVTVKMQQCNNVAMAQWNNATM